MAPRYCPHCHKRLPASQLTPLKVAFRDDQYDWLMEEAQRSALSLPDFLTDLVAEHLSARTPARLCPPRGGRSTVRLYRDRLPMDIVADLPCRLSDAVRCYVDAEMEETSDT